MRLALRDIIRSGPPTLDRRALTFQLDGRVFRAFRGESAALFERLLRDDSIEELFEHGLVRFRPADIEVESYELVVEVDRVPVVSYPPEWPTTMLRDAGIAMAGLGAALSGFGLGLHDGHPWNILYAGPRPVFVDLGSIIETSEVTKGWIREFRRHVVLPLALHRIGLHRLADAVQRTQRGGATAQMDRRFMRAFPLGYARLTRRRNEPAAYFNALRDYLGGVDGGAAATNWSNYYPANEPDVGDTDRYNDKQASVDTLLARLPKGTVLDLGSNMGWYARLAALNGHSVTAIDLDDRTLGSLYALAKREDLPILPLRMDLMWPPGSSGLALEYKPAPDRLRSDVLMALAVLHHLTARQGVTFEVFARIVDLFTGRFAIIEFIPRDDPFISNWSIAREPWYTVDAFKVAMAPFFRVVDALPSAPAPRQILLFERV